MKKLKTTAALALSFAMAFNMNVSVEAKTTPVVKNQVQRVWTQPAMELSHRVGPIQTMASAPGSYLPWYKNTGTTIPAGHTLEYGRYHLIDKLEVGDIIFEPKAGFNITGHIAIIEGKFYDAASDTWYLRTIESTPPCVLRSILDDNAADEEEAQFFRVKGATREQKQAAVDFCISQLGKDYNLDMKKHTSENETGWYCSELVWAAYYKQGFDIEAKGVNEPGVTPRDIARSKAVEAIPYK